MHHKRGKGRRSRAGCKLCKSWKINGVRTEALEGERFGDHRRPGWAEVARGTLLTEEDKEWMAFGNDRDAELCW